MCVQESRQINIFSLCAEREEMLFIGNAITTLNFYEMILQESSCAVKWLGKMFELNTLLYLICFLQGQNIC